MTDDISNYSFDFEKEVDDLRRSFSSIQRASILFADVHVFRPEGETSRGEIKHLTGDELSKSLCSSEIRRVINEKYKRYPDSSSYQDAVLPVKFIALRDNEKLQQS